MPEKLSKVLRVLTINAWQSLACSPGGIAVPPPTERSYTNASPDRRMLYTDETSELRSYRTKYHRISTMDKKVFELKRQ